MFIFFMRKNPSTFNKGKHTIYKMSSRLRVNKIIIKIPYILTIEIDRNQGS